MTISYIDLARVTQRAAFIANHGYRFLGGVVSMRRPPRPDATRVLGGPRETQSKDDADGDDPTTVDPSAALLSPRAPAAKLLLAIHKVMPSYPSMITVGRTANNDIHLPDVGVSKFHAFFRAATDELVDAGSRNGTWVGEKKLEPKGAGVPIHLGDRIRFGTVELVILDAGGAWDLAHD